MRLLNLEMDAFTATFTEEGVLQRLARRRPGGVVYEDFPGASLMEIWTQREDSRIPSRCYGQKDFRIRLREDAERGIVWDGESIDGAIRYEYEARIQRGGLLRFRLIVENRGDVPVYRITFPGLARLNVGREQRVAIPYSTGWSLDPEKLHDGEEIRLNYPVHAAMQWMDLYTRDSGLYLGVHDGIPVLKQLIIRRDEGGAHLAWSFPDLLLLKGERIELPPVILALHNEDWRAGAAIYREWALNVMKFPEPPEWIARRPAWAWVGMKGQHAKKIDRTFVDLPAVTNELHEHGVPVPHLSSYMEHGHDTHYPDYVAGVCQGGEEGLIRAVEAIHQRGERLALYTNGRLIDPEGSFGRLPGWQQHCVQIASCAKQNVYDRSGTFTEPNLWDAEGALAKEKYTNVTFAIGCPSDSYWADLFADRLAYLVEKYNIDGIYIDQVCGCSSLPCYASNHGHKKPNLAWAGYLSFMRNLRERIHKIKPEVYLATEGMTDIYGQFFDIQQAHNDWVHQVLGKADHLPEMYRITFPESVVAIGPVSSGEDIYVRLAHAVMSGFDLFPMLKHNSTGAFRSFLKSVLERRETLWPHIAKGQVLPWTSAEPEGIHVYAIASPKAVVVNGAWGSEEKHDDLPAGVNVTIRGCPEVREGRIWTGSGECSLDFKWAAGQLSFRAPEGLMFSAIFIR